MIVGTKRDPIERVRGKKIGSGFQETKGIPTVVSRKVNKGREPQTRPTRKEDRAAEANEGRGRNRWVCTGGHSIGVLWWGGGWVVCGCTWGVGGVGGGLFGLRGN